jgi:hypothetical protein
MTSIRVVAQQYIDNEWAVVPLNPGEKRASVRWQSTTYKPSDFNDDSNIAVKLGDPSKGLVDVDCDHPFAVAAAKALLPSTGLVFGRSSKPSSHYLFMCPGIKTTQFTDVKGADGTNQMLVEIRSTNSYTMFPPSLHPSGEAVTWEIERDIMERTPEEMFADVRAVAIATLVAIHYPGHGNKHFTIGQYLPGLLLTKLDPILVKQIIRVAASVAGDGDWADREKAINATIDKFKRGEPVTGGPKLADSLGADVVAKLRAWLNVADVDALEEMNAKHFAVRLGADYVVGRTDDPDEIVFQNVTALRHEYANRSVQVGTDKDGNAVFKPLFETWFHSPSRRSHRRVVFSPPPIQHDEQDFNMWRGYGVEGDADPHLVIPFLEHLRHIVCNDDPECYEYTMNLLARVVQRPGEAGQVAMVMRGAQGAGKGVVVDALGRIIGRSHYSHIVKSEQVIGRFNKAISGKVVVFLDEAFWAGDKREQGALKALITERTMLVEPKGIDPFTVDNFAHVFCATNEEWAVPAELDDRRFFVLKVNDRWSYAACHASDRKRYFDRLWGSLASGGYASLLKLLQQRDIEEFDVFAVPNTKELMQQKIQTLRGVMKWLYDAVYTGELMGGSWPTKPVSNDELFMAYCMWCDTNRERKLSKIDFGRKVTKILRGKSATGHAVRAGKLRTQDDVKKLLPPLDLTHMETIELLWSSGEWSSMLLDTSSEAD